LARGKEKVQPCYRDFTAANNTPTAHPPNSLIGGHFQPFMPENTRQMATLTSKF